MTTKFKLRYKPVKPERKTVRCEITFSEGDSLDYIVSQVDSHTNLKDLKVEIDTTCYGCYDGPCDCARTYFVCARLQNDIEYQEDLDRYEKRLAEYEQWLADNKETVEKYIKEKEEAALRKRTKEIEGMARQLEKNRKALDKLQTEYEKALKKKA